MTTMEDTWVICPTCEWHHHPANFVSVLWDVMGDPRTSITVCRDCARHAIKPEGEQS